VFITVTDTGMDSLKHVNTDTDIIRSNTESNTRQQYCSNVKLLIYQNQVAYHHLRNWLFLNFLTHYPGDKLF
jgi:hypothetical protein